VEVAVSALSFSVPVSVVSFSRPVVGGVASLRVRCSDGLVRVGRARFVSPASVAALESAAVSGLPVRFGAFAPWSPNRWFSSVSAFRLGRERSCSLSFASGVSRPWRVALRAALRFGLARFGTPYPVSLSVSFTEGELLESGGEISSSSVLGWMNYFASDLGRCGDMRHNITVKCDDKSNLVKVVDTLFHELRHHEQVAEGWLNKGHWKGEDQRGFAYNDKDCEKDANEEARKAVREFFADGTVWDF